MCFKPHAKCDLVDNNMAEIFNVFIMDARYMPIVSILKEIFTQVKRIASKNQWAASLEQLIAPNILKKLEKRIENARFWEASRAQMHLLSS